MSTFAAVFSPTGEAWRGSEIDLADMEVIDDITDLMLDFAAEGGEDTAVLLIEADDEWFGVVRAGEDAEPMAYLSDARVAHDHPVAALLLEAGAVEAPDLPEGGAAKPVPEPGGDADLLTDLGITGDELRSLTVSGGTLPGDVLAEIAERAGFSDLLDVMKL